jgi:crotonobetaine/carnitine-CoA ligase
MTAADILAEFPPPERTLPAMLEQQARRYGDRPLFGAGQENWSFADARTIAARFAGSLAAADVRANDRVALMCSNRPELMQVYLGCGWLGATAVPINTASRGPQLQHVLSNSGAKLLAIEASSLEALDHVDLSKLPLERIWLIGGEAPPSRDGIPMMDLPLPAAPLPAADVDPAQNVAILYTSGTTGPSKGVCCPHAQYFWWGLNSVRNLEIRESDVLCTTLPLYHSNALGTFYAALLSGARIVAEPRFSASQFWQVQIDRSATVTYLLGAMVPILLAREPSPQERSHAVRCALAPGVPANLHAAFEQRSGIHLIDGYGSTETNFIIGTTAEDRRGGTMGTVRVGYHARIIDQSGGDVPPGQPGELIVSSDEPLAFATGYFAMPDKTTEAFRAGWFHTGDRAVLDPDGYFRFVDRLKDAIRRRGENISSFEVEQVLLSHPDVGNAAVFPVPSELAEDEVMAAIVRRPGSALTEGELCEFCRPRLARFAVPRFIAFVDMLPTTENGKVQKYKLRERGVPAGTWDREAVSVGAKR